MRIRNHAFANIVVRNDDCAQTGDQFIAAYMVAVDMCVDDEINGASCEFRDGFDQRRCGRRHGVVDKDHIIIADQQFDIAAAKSVLAVEHEYTGRNFYGLERCRKLLCQHRAGTANRKQGVENRSHRLSPM